MLKTWWSNLSLPSFKIKTPHITWGSAPAKGWIADVLRALGIPTSIPKMNVQWYARGGIVSRPSLIGAGEAGKEAIVPLERNTEWISKVAQQMNSEANRSDSDGNDEVVRVLNLIYDVARNIAENSGKNSGSIDINRLSRQITYAQASQARRGAY